MESLRHRGCDARYVISDNAWNIDPASADLIPMGEVPLHSLDYLHDSAEVAPPHTRRTMSELLGAMRTLPVEERLSSYVSPLSFAFAIREANESLLAFRKMFETEKPDMAMVLHGANFWGRIIAYLCDEMGIPCVAYQEGLLRNRDQTTQNKQAFAAENMARLLVWSDAARDAYARAGVDPAKLAVTGIPHLDDAYRVAANPAQRTALARACKELWGFDPDLPLVLFALPQLARYDGDPVRAVRALSEWADRTHTPLALRFHPFEHPDTLAQFERALSHNRQVKVMAKPDPVLLVLASAAVVSQHTSLALEALALDTPLVEIDLDHAGVLESFVEQGVATRVDGEALDAIREVAEGKRGADGATLEAWRERHVGPRDGRGVARVIAAIGRLIGECMTKGQT